jgi:hypothetical protein
MGAANDTGPSFLWGMGAYLLTMPMIEAAIFQQHLGTDSSP